MDIEEILTIMNEYVPGACVYTKIEIKRESNLVKYSYDNYNSLEEGFDAHASGNVSLDNYVKAIGQLIKAGECRITSDYSPDNYLDLRFDGKGIYAYFHGPYNTISTYIGKEPKALMPNDMNEK